MRCCLEKKGHFPHCQSHAASQCPLATAGAWPRIETSREGRGGRRGGSGHNGRPPITLGVSKSRLRAGWPRPHRFQAGRFSAGDNRHLRFPPEFVLEAIFMLYLHARSRR
jgi:hypothetical protein